MTYFCFHILDLEKSWQIRILQFECGSPMIAPDGCLQYHTGVFGNVSSFNWKLEDNSNDHMFANSLSNLSYSVCIRRESGYCSIDWTPGVSFQVKGCDLNMAMTLRLCSKIIALFIPENIIC